VNIKTSACTAAAAVVLLTSGLSTAGDYQHPETGRLVAFVRDAAALVSQQGEKAFALFKKPSGPWREGGRYVFVLDTAGNRYVYPPDPDNERINVFDLTDLNGRPFGEIFTRPVQPPRTEGWAHYLWTRPDDVHPTWKTTFVVRTRAPSGTEYIIGSGDHTMLMEKAFIVDMVDDAAAMLQKRGRQGFALLRDRKGDYYFNETYVFVTSFDGREVVNPAFPMLEGRSVINAVDARGRAFVRDYLAALREHDSAWVSYQWPKPGETLPAQKEVYVKKVVIDGQPFAIGSGVYADWLKSR